MRILNIFTVYLLLIISGAQSQDFSGQYAAQTPEGKLNLHLKKHDNSTYSGQLKSNQGVMVVQGVLSGGVLEGYLGDQWAGFKFNAELAGSNLIFTIFEMNEYNYSDGGSTQQFTFVKLASGADTESKDIQAPKDKILINGIELPREQIDQLKSTYKVEPRPGEYWYDAKSGLYGVVGYPAFGFMLPGHQFGTLKRDASNGQTGIIVNGRELPQSEWAVWSYIIGYWIQPGSYWLDDKGNAGYEGSPVVVINLYVAAQQNSYRGRGSSGDNFWSSRFSAGNYDSGNQRGYVSVPGYGPVGYGF